MNETGQLIAAALTMILGSVVLAVIAAKLSSRPRDIS